MMLVSVIFANFRFSLHIYTLSPQSQLIESSQASTRGHLVQDPSALVPELTVQIHFIVVTVTVKNGAVIINGGCNTIPVLSFSCQVRWFRFELKQNKQQRLFGQLSFEGFHYFRIYVESWVSLFLTSPWIWNRRTTRSLDSSSTLGSVYTRVIMNIIQPGRDFIVNPCQIVASVILDSSTSNTQSHIALKTPFNDHPQPPGPRACFSRSVEIGWRNGATYRRVFTLQGTLAPAQDLGEP